MGTCWVNLTVGAVIERQVDARTTLYQSDVGVERYDFVASAIGGGIKDVVVVRRRCQESRQELARRWNLAGIGEAGLIAGSVGRAAAAGSRRAASLSVEYGRRDNESQARSKQQFISHGRRHIREQRGYRRTELDILFEIAALDEPSCN